MMRKPNTRNKGNKTLLYLALSGLLCCPLGLTWAQSDGVVLIDQRRAEAGGITDRDVPGFPVTLNDPGSYRLAGNLTVTDASTTVIEITTDHVTLDLNGFVISGITVCEGTPVTCNPPGGGAGNVGVQAAGRANITVTNGTVTGMGFVGIFCGDVTRGGCIVRDIKATSNAIVGVLAQGGVVTGNTAASNGGVGIVGDTVVNNTANENGAAGIAGANTTVLENTAFRNGAVGLRLGNASGYANNVLNENHGGNANPQVDGGIEIGTNVCGGDTVCP